MTNYKKCELFLLRALSHFSTMDSGLNAPRKPPSVTHLVLLSAVLKANHSTVELHHLYNI